MSFDLKTHHRDKKGNIEKVTPYRLRVVNGVQRFERPVGSGKWYDAQNHLVEETEPTIIEADEVDETAELKAKIAELEAKLAEKPALNLEETLAEAKVEAKAIEVQKKPR